MSNKAIQISFIVPTYNVDKYLRKCISSLQAQTVGRFEIIIVEDCSTDGSLRLAERLAARDARIKLIRHARNKGLGPARNTGLEHAQGTYICFVDSDDWVDPGYGEAFFLEAERTKADMVVGSFYAVFEQGARIAPHFVDPAVRYATLPFNARTCPAVLSMPTPVWDKCYRRDFIERHQLRFPALIGEDIPFQWQAMTQAKRMSVVGEPFYYYRIRDSQKNRSLTSGRAIFADVFLAQEQALDYLTTSGHFDTYRAIWWDRMIKELLHLTEKSGDTLIADDFVAKVFHMMLRRSLQPVDFSLLNRSYLPDHVLFKAMYARQCASWKEFQELVRRSFLGSHKKKPLFFGVKKMRFMITRQDLNADETSDTHLLRITGHKTTFTHYPDLPEYAAASCDGQRIILLPPVHDAHMEPARVTVSFSGRGSRRLWYFLACSQPERRAELVISQRAIQNGVDVASHHGIVAETETVLHVGEKILLSSINLPADARIEDLEFEFSVRCRSGFPAWASDVTISHFYGEDA